MADGSLLFSLKGHNSMVKDVVYSPDGKKLASASSDNTVKLWNVADGSLIFCLEGHNSTVNDVVYSPDGKKLASASADNTVKLWNVADGSLISSLEGHSDAVSALAYSPDGKTIASASSDHTVKLWDVNFDLNLDALMVRACDWLHDYLTHNPNVSTSDQRLLEGTSASQLEQT